MFHECYDKNGNYIGRTTSEEGAKNLILQANLLIDQKEEAERIKREILLQQEAKRQIKQQKKACRINFIKSYYKHFLAILATITALVLLILPYALYGDIYGPNTTYFDRVKRVFYWVTPEFKIPSHATEIDGATFCDCDHLTSVTIPNGVAVIEDYAFLGCTSLISVTIPDSVIEIGKKAFYDCHLLTGITIPNKVTKIGEMAFCGCYNLTSVKIPNSVTEIQRDAFAGITGELIINCNIPNASSLYYGTFNGAKFSKVIIGNNVSLIGNYAFSCCNNLTSVTIPDSVIEIGEEAFYKCKSLINVTIGKGVRLIKDSAFNKCDNLKNIYCKPITPPAIEYYSPFPKSSDLKIYVPVESYHKYTKRFTSFGGISQNNWGYYSNNIKPYDF